MNKQTKTLLGVAVLAGVGYYLYTKYGKKTTSNFANLVAPNCKTQPAQCPCPQGHCPNKKDEGTMPNGQPYEICANGHLCFPSGGGASAM